MPGTNEPQALTLHFSKHVRIPGESLHGSVELYFPRVHEENIQKIKVQLRGAIKTSVSRDTGPNTGGTYKETIPLIRDDLVLWTRGSAYPQPGSHTLIFPFAFVLPRHLPPSFHAKGGRGVGSISYSVEVVGDRPGVFQFNRRVGSLFPVLPCASPTQASTRPSLLRGWQGKWLSVFTKDQIRQHPWSDDCHVEAKLLLPNLPSYPTGVPIPFRLRVTTQTKVMRQDDRPAPRTDDKSLFPAPPVDPAQVELQLERVVWVKAGNSAERFRCPAQKELGGLGNSEVSNMHQAVRVHMQEHATWITEEADKKGKQKGTWSRTVVFESSLVLLCPPTLSLETIKCSYRLHFKVPLQGLFNNLKCDMPIQVDSGLHLPSPIEGEASTSSTIPYGQHADHTSSVMDLPPAYWTGEDHDWEFDEKK